MKAARSPAKSTNATSAVLPEEAQLPGEAPN